MTHYGSSTHQPHERTAKAVNISLTIDWNSIQLDTSIIYLWIDTKFILVTLGVIVALRVRKLIQDKKRRLAKAKWVAPATDVPVFDAF